MVPQLHGQSVPPKPDSNMTAVGAVGSTFLTPRVLVGIRYIPRAHRGSHIPTLRAKYIPYSYMDPLGHSLGKIGV